MAYQLLGQGGLAGRRFSHPGNVCASKCLPVITRILLILQKGIEIELKFAVGKDRVFLYFYNSIGFFIHRDKLCIAPPPAWYVNTYYNFANAKNTAGEVHLDVLGANSDCFRRWKTLVLFRSEELCASSYHKQ